MDIINPTSAFISKNQLFVDNFNNHVFNVLRDIQSSSEIKVTSPIIIAGKLNTGKTYLIQHVFKNTPQIVSIEFDDLIKMILRKKIHNKDFPKEFYTAQTIIIDHIDNLDEKPATMQLLMDTLDQFTRLNIQTILIYSFYQKDCRLFLKKLFKIYSPQIMYIIKKPTKKERWNILQKIISQKSSFILPLPIKKKILNETRNLSIKELISIINSFVLLYRYPIDFTKKFFIKNYRLRIL